ncbi:hypothetical protein A2707_01510 [Candidatus Saccharibacteria bacterium RIFCSPHIGHO2_01_FULL_45_15]|nr:MAG: hypothetical protein A2707_01510 [Candidatus Saccharibacteria bacterium RIFCSPHIGHO2_01_FULL_45_15]OGL27958.1 MAG: hypothetical protein A3C39_02610 [Candidatus Saccharibacteria bacterium RIFCSPHIGHO2_02_FULL_46_12]OGL31738.1 MAG: hypothetical protein A3E76_01335 [Candidatus Saccharibacteria bacterium RIFCSPHIGHO2_12_FULL_44_22]
MNVVVVYNPKSGSALPANELRTLFDDVDVAIIEFVDVTDDIKKSLKKYTNSQTIIAAIGGDGTINSVAQQIVDTPAILAPLPGGTLNHFTKDLGIDQDLATAISNIPSSTPRSIDVATVNERLFLNNSSIGVYPSSLRTRKRFEDRLGKWPAAVIGTIRATVSYHLYDVTVSGQTFRTPFLFVGNNDYHIEAIGQSRDTLDAGTLSVYAITIQHRRDLLKLFLYALIGKLSDHEHFHSYLTDSFTLHTKQKKLSVSTDGELFVESSPLTYAIKKRSLKIIGS